jgi:hypothetical protein
MFIIVDDMSHMNVGNVIRLSASGGFPTEDHIIAGFTANVTSRRLREDYDDDEEAGRRLSQTGPGKVHLQDPLHDTYGIGSTAVIISATVVGGDPITRYGDTSIKFWLPNFQLMPLLRTSHINVYASTFPGPSSDLQWFERFVVTTSDEEPIVQVSIKKDIKLNRTTPPRIFTQLDVTIMNAPGPLKVMDPIYVGKGGQELYEDYATIRGDVRFRVGRQLHHPPRIFSRSYEYVHIVAPDIVFAIAPAHAAVEFRSEWFTGSPDSAHKYAHLDMYIMQQVGEQNFGGILPQLWGVQPMTEEVQAMTKPPDDVKDVNESDKVSVCAVGSCKDETLPILNM